MARRPPSPLTIPSAPQGANAPGNKVFAHDGRILTLGRRLKSGGAGSIYPIIEAPDLVAKIYHWHVERSVYERKIEAMLDLVPDLPDLEDAGVREVQMAWPRLLLRNQQEVFLGFAMPLLDFRSSVELECVIQERQARAQGLPTGLGARVTLAANLAWLVAAFHQRGHFIVDLKPVNLRFYRRSLHVAMLDCDGCSVQGKGERFPAPQYTPEYLAPEFFGRGSCQSDEESQDRFALAVVIFQLLNFGIHPFTGRPTSDQVPTDIPGRIADRCYAYGVRPSPRMMPNPASGHTSMPVDLRSMFDRAFESTGLARPRAAEWAHLLHEYGRRSTGKLVACSTDRKHEHFASMPCATCARAALLAQAAQLATMAPRPRPRPHAPPAGRAPVPTQPPKRSGAKVMIGIVAAIGSFGVVVALLSDGRSRRSESPPPATDRQPAKAMSQRSVLLAEKQLDLVLTAAGGESEQAVLDLVKDLPGKGFDGDEESCELALKTWRNTVAWTVETPSFAGEGYLDNYRQAVTGSLEIPSPSRGPCSELYYSQQYVIYSMERCHIAQHATSPPPWGSSNACAEVLAAGVAVLRQGAIHAQSRICITWHYLAQAYVLADDATNAYRSFVVSLLLNPSAEPHEYQAVTTLILLSPPQMRMRAEILQAQAIAKVLRWHRRTPSPQIAAKASAKWPSEKPSDASASASPKDRTKKMRKPPSP
jgi:hypothetical protein